MFDCSFNWDFACKVTINQNALFCAILHSANGRQLRDATMRIGCANKYKHWYHKINHNVDKVNDWLSICGCYGVIVWLFKRARIFFLSTNNNNNNKNKTLIHSLFMNAIAMLIFLFLVFNAATMFINMNKLIFAIVDVIAMRCDDDVDAVIRRHLTM